MTKRHMAWLVYLAAVSGCSGASGDPQDTVFEGVDSAGVLTVENPADLVLNVPDLVLEEELRIGTVEGSPEEQFQWLMDLAIGESGEMYALDAGSRTVRVFSSEGDALLEFGGPGGGPGEFSNEMLRVAVRGDSLIVQDRARFHVFTIRGEFLGSTLQRVTGNAMPTVLTRGPQGWLLGQVNFSPPLSDVQRTTQDTFRVVPLNLTTGTAGRPLVVAPSGLRRYLPDMGRSRGQWFGPEVAASVRANGEIYLVEGDDYEINVLSPEGRLERRIRADVERTPLRNGDLEDWIQKLVESQRYPFGVDEIRALGPPEARPISGRLLVAPGGRLLMHRRDLGSLPRLPRIPLETPLEKWDLVGVDGRVEGRLGVDQLVSLRALTDSLVYAIVRDELDVQYIVRYRIVSPSD